jgi:hypothetical protein
MVAGDNTFSISRLNHVAGIIARIWYLCQRENGKGAARPFF